MKTVLKAFLTLTVFLGVLLLLDSRIGELPSIVRIVNPSRGVWSNARASNDLQKLRELKIVGLQAPVAIAFDSLDVPHIYAQNLHDLYLAQGYVTARLRLWQMEFQTLAAAGRLSEVVGRRAIEYDRYQRRIGMGYAAEQSAEVLLSHPITNVMVSAYAEGVNACIANLTVSEVPIEYKLLHYAPEEWTPLKTALLMKSLAYTLSFNNEDVAMTRTLQHLGPARMDSLFPDRAWWDSPIIPRGTPFREPSVAVPVPPASMVVPPAGLAMNMGPQPPAEGLGSNNWALAPSRTASGHALLSNDPHLTLSMPSLWFLVGLHAPGLNVMGASLPGAPGVIIGCNKQIAWGVTNTGADVTDWYRITFQDQTQKAYAYNGKWEPTTFREERIGVRKEKSLVERVPYTLHGPVVYQPGEKPFDKSAAAGLALRWLAHQPSNELLTFYKINKARNHVEFQEALRHFTCPAQNFVYADIYGQVGLVVNGEFPLKYPGQGKYVLDGSRPEHAWRGYIPRNRVPQLFNPARGHISSANQSPTDSTYPYYLHWHFASAERGVRLNDLLDRTRSATVQDMARLQRDDLDARAPQLLRHLLPLVDSTQPRLVAAAHLLRTWDAHYRADSRAATLWNLWREYLQATTWDDNLPGDSLQRPRIDTWHRLVVTQPNSHWFDNDRTAEREDLRWVVNCSLAQTLDSLGVSRTDMNRVPEWGDYRGLDINHIAKVPGLGRINLQTGGNKTTLNAQSRTHGPSLRFVKELNGEDRFHAIYPGGQSGHPLSPHYDDMLPRWLNGQLRTFRVVTETHAARVIRLTPAK